MGLHRVEKLDNSSVDQILPFLYTFVFLSSLCVQPTNQKLLWINQQVPFFFR
ncbi:hypothetical protein JHK86_041980 [Glycine max]|nr:hypothetical protein JHK86_041980 [Glycine max]